MDADKCHKHDIMLYTLSTCGWCKKMKRFLDAMDVEYQYVDVDRLNGDEKERVMKEVMKHNPRGSFPTMVVDDSKVIVGFQEDEVKGALVE